MEKLKADGYKSGYTTEIQDIRKVWEEERLRVLGVQYKGEGFGEGKFVPCVPSWTEKIMNDFVSQIGGTITESNAVGILRRTELLQYGIRRFLHGLRDRRCIRRQAG